MHGAWQGAGWWNACWNSDLDDDDLACAGLRRAFGDAVFVEGLGYVDGAIFAAFEAQEYAVARAPKRVERRAAPM